MNDTDAAREAQARRRFAVISLVRLAGVFVILFGILAANKALPFAVPDAFAYLLVVMGMGQVFVIPTLLSKRWSSKPRP